MKGIEFIASSGNKYYYDNDNGFICKEKTIRQTDNRINSRPNATESNVEEYLSAHGYRQLLLETTQSCNLRCKYCCYSEQYSRTRNHSNGAMSFETAKKAIDHFMEHFHQTCYINPLKKCAISFYGGEPLLNFALIKEVVGYVKKEYKQYEVDYSLTTNALLLSEDIASYLVENNFSIVISIDGDKESHDRNRVKPDNSGSFDDVYKSITSLRRNHGNYPKFGVSMCLDYHTDLYRLAEFVKENDLFVVSVNMVSDLETSYYNKFTVEDKDRFYAQMEELKLQYFELASQEGMLLAERNLLLSLFAFGYLEFACHSLNDESRPDFMPFTASCIPGEKLYVTVDGTIHMCERINPNFPIGHVDYGLDYAKIAGYINQVNSHYERCKNCDVSRVCSICLARATNNDCVSIPASFCAEKVASVNKTLVSYVDLFEAKPNQLEKIIMSYFVDLRNKTGEIYD